MNPRLHSSRTALLRASRLVAVVLAVASSLTAATDAPVSPNAQPGVGALLRFFNNVSGRYIVSGQQEIAWDENRKDEDINYIIQHTGKTPGVRGFDFLKYIESPASRTRQAATQRAIEWWKAGGIVTFCTHFFVDIGSTNGSPHFYTPGANGNPQGTNFDIRQAVIAGTPENSEFMAKLDVMAEELIKLRDAGVPVIWRPFHETGGTWFWWSRHGAAPFIQAWRIMFQRYTQVHGLTNLIWCYNPIDSTTIMQTWYPGDDVVDMISLDVYPPAGTHPTYTADYQRMRDFKGGRKPVVMSENGAIPNVEQMFAEGGGWGYFCTWNGFENNPAHNTVAFLTSVYHHPKVLTLDELAGPYAIYSQPLVLAAQSQSAPPGTALTLTAAPAAGVPANLQWQRNGVALNTASAITLDLALADVQPATAGLYSLTSAAGTSAPAIVGVSTTSKVIGFGEARDQNILHPNGNTFDQVLLTGVAATITADHALGQITRTSFIDVDHDIVQVEFSGPGTLTLVLDNAGPAASPVNYNQNVSYVKGHAGIVITGATEQTNVSVFTVGRATAFDPTGTYRINEPISPTNNPANNGSPLFHGHASTNYDGVADIAFIAIASANGKFGGVRTANASYFAPTGFTGIYAPEVTFTGPVYLGELSAFDAATPVLLLGSASDVRIAGGSLAQPNNQPVQVSGIAQIKFTAGSNSHHAAILAKTNQGVLTQNGVDVTTKLVVNP